MDTRCSGFPPPTWDLIADRLASSGAPVEWGSALPGERFYTQDPWGNRLEFLANRP